MKYQYHHNHLFQNHLRICLIDVNSIILFYFKNNLIFNPFILEGLSALFKVSLLFYPVLTLNMNFILRLLIFRTLLRIYLNFKGLPHLLTIIKECSIYFYPINLYYWKYEICLSDYPLIHHFTDLLLLFNSIINRLHFRIN